MACGGSAPPCGRSVTKAGGGGGDLVSTAQFGDFDFRFRFRIAANGNSGDPTSLQIGASNAPRRLYTGYSVTIPAGWRGVVTSVPKHGMPVRPIAILEAGDHDEDLALPISYTTDTGGNVQIGTQAAIGVLTLIPAHSVECKVE